MTAARWDDILRDQDLRKLFEQYISTRDEFSLGVFAERLCDSGDAALQDYGLHISREIQLSHEFPCWHAYTPRSGCNRCRLRMESGGFYDKYGYDGWMPRERIVPRLPFRQIRNYGWHGRPDFDGDLDATKPLRRETEVSRHPWADHRLDVAWSHRLGVPAALRCGGQDLVSLWPWLQKNVCLQRVELTSLPPLGVSYTAARNGEFHIWVIGIQGCWQRIGLRDYEEQIAGLSDIAIVEACFENAAPWLDVEIGSGLLSADHSWSIMDLLATRPIVQRSLQYVPRAVDLGSERWYAEYL